MNMMVLGLPGKEFLDERSSESAGTLVDVREFEHVSEIQYVTNLGQDCMEDLPVR